MMEDLAATPQDIAAALHVSQSTVYRWLTVGNAPRAPSLALYWMTRWGLSEIDAELCNAAAVYRGLAESLERELWQMRQDIDKAGRLGDYGSANDPVRGMTGRYGLDDAGNLLRLAHIEGACRDKASFLS
jgi:predicted DNA-binding transcriptional regulator AlpA